MDELDERDDLRVGILTGAGGFFSAGADLKAIAAGQSCGVPGRGFAGMVERPPVKPLIGAIEGFALAGGFELALVCDLLVVAAGTKFGLLEPRRGLIAAGGGLLRLPLHVPYRIAMELALTADSVAAETLMPYGLINRLVAPGQTVDVALDLARAICVNAPLSVALSKEIVASARDWPAAEMFERQRVHERRIVASADAREGTRAFVEKRPPVWSGR